MFENRKAFQSLIDQNGLKFVRIVFQFFHTLIASFRLIIPVISK